MERQEPTSNHSHSIIHRPPKSTVNTVLFLFVQNRCRHSCRQNTPLLIPLSYFRHSKKRTIHYDPLETC